MSTKYENMFLSIYSHTNKTHAYAFLHMKIIIIGRISLRCVEFKAV